MGYCLGLACSMRQMKINEPAERVCRGLDRNGWAAYIVGGAVRDMVMGLAPKDWDIATDGQISGGDYKSGESSYWQYLSGNWTWIGT